MENDQDKTEIYEMTREYDKPHMHLFKHAFLLASRNYSRAEITYSVFETNKLNDYQVSPVLMGNVIDRAIRHLGEIRDDAIRSETSPNLHQSKSIRSWLKCGETLEDRISCINEIIDNWYEFNRGSEGLKAVSEPDNQ